MSGSSEEDVASYFLHLWRQQSMSSKPNIDQTEWEAAGQRSPTALDTEKSSNGFALVGPDKLSVSYPHVGIHEHDVGAVRANRAAPWKRLLYYFEVFVRRCFPRGRISVGFTASSFDLRHHPGWEANSCGYHGVDGKIYRGREYGETLRCPTYMRGDTVGCGVNYATQEFFFTKNGKFVGIVKKDMEDPVFPTIGLHSHNDEYGSIIFYGYEDTIRGGQQKIIDEMEIGRHNVFRIVRSYLQHYGYEETLWLFDNAIETGALLQQEDKSDDSRMMYAIKLRKMIRQMIMSGQVDDAITKLKEWFPQTLEDDFSPIRFLLHSQKFIELVRDGNLSEAIVFSGSEFDKFKRVLKVDDQVKDCASLLAYKQPDKSYAGYLLEESHRELVADALNAKILSTNPNMKDKESCLQSSLERLIRQLTTCFSKHRSYNGGQGEDFDLRRIVGIHED
ncbi:ran-binding protein 10 [Dorcoceras hygrometricum]|uniref:Ran-binding protein 10 n=1 Tax=Dorcoceras hygrometricum TaxID=472368 RepID=A0A2Z7DCR5_9LAMI|nr:ran-binding protein 10 [Dorcoceras hygrometricum]